MELIMISSSKLKIMLSADDMQKYSLDADIDYADSKTRKAFRSILEEARQKTGFDAQSEKIFIQLYPSKKGGCEVYITKIGEDSEAEECSELSLKLCGEKTTRRGYERSTGIIPAPKKQAAKERSRAYSFSSSEHMIAVCKRLLAQGWKGQSSAYSGEGRFYIILKDKGSSEFIFLDKLSFIIEYGSPENHDTLMKFLCEHTNCICKVGAVEKLGVL